MVFYDVTGFNRTHQYIEGERIQVIDSESLGTILAVSFAPEDAPQSLSIKLDCGAIVDKFENEVHLVNANPVN